MAINKQALRLSGVTEADYKQWCIDNHKPAYLSSTKKDFFDRIKDGRLVKDANTGKLIKKYRRSK